MGADRAAEGVEAAEIKEWQLMMESRILFVDDDTEILAMVDQYLGLQGYSVQTVDNGIDALGIVKENDIDIVFTDYKMPEFNGLELLAAIKKYKPDTEVIIITGYASMESAIQAMKYGSYDYLQKPFKLEHLRLIIDRITEEKKVARQTQRLRKRSRQRHRYGGLVGLSPRMQAIYDLIDALAIEEPMVVLQGERGTGKTLVARTIHDRSSRRDKPFISVNCGAVGADLPEARLKDYVDELIQSADGGTLYLDEIADVAEDLRLKLLQAFKAEEIKQNADGSGGGVRTIAGTSREMGEIVQSGALQRGFINLLNAVLIKLPPLRERKEDLCLLIHTFTHAHLAGRARQSETKGKDARGLYLAPKTLDLLMGYHWPGNLDELKLMIARVYDLGIEGTLYPEHLPAEIRSYTETATA
jgi:DNA-binding NtrC family response regulator